MSFIDFAKEIVQVGFTFMGLVGVIKYLQNKSWYSNRDSFFRTTILILLIGLFVWINADIFGRG